MSRRIIRSMVVGMILFFALIGIAFSAVFVAMRFGLLNVRGSIDQRNEFFGTALPAAKDKRPCLEPGALQCAFTATPEWVVIREGLRKDAPIIARVSRETGVSERMIAAVVVPEQMRFFTAEREVFKRYFEPLKILGSLSQFSLGVSGIKQETARTIESFAASTTSPYYPGPGAAPLIAYATNVDHDTELYARLTDPKDHYYSYLYTALFVKEIQAQWASAGFDLSRNPGVVVTLFNLGFAASRPNPSPQVAGAVVSAGGVDYSYGQLGAAFWSSEELVLEFPRD